MQRRDALMQHSSRGRGGFRGRGRGGRPLESRKRVGTSKREDAEAADLQKRMADVLPKPGEVFSLPGGMTPVFADFPLSRYTAAGLTQEKYISPTAIQLTAVPHALAGCVSLAVVRGRFTGVAVPRTLIEVATAACAVGDVAPRCRVTGLCRCVRQ